jgi:hypothetical protein
MPVASRPCVGIGLAVSYLALLDLWLIHHGPSWLEPDGR